MINVKVPATTANLGPGFDTLGLALNLYNKFSFNETTAGVVINGSLDLMENKKNLVYTSMLKTLDVLEYNISGININIEADIPNSRGLGSSAACILGGVIGANELAGSTLSLEEILNIATEIEGHPDNIAPALFGGLVVSLMEGDKIYHNKINVAQGIKFVALIPDFTLSTSVAREVLPSTVIYKEAVDNVSRVSLLLSALSNGKFDLLKPSLKDNLHQPYRGKLIPGFNQIIEKSYEFGALGAYISGAGPTIMTIIDNEDSAFVNRVNGYLSSIGNNWSVIELKINLLGARVI